MEEASEREKDANIERKRKRERWKEWNEAGARRPASGEAREKETRAHVHVPRLSTQSRETRTRLELDWPKKNERNVPRSRPPVSSRNSCLRGPTWSEGGREGERENYPENPRSCEANWAIPDAVLGSACPKNVHAFFITPALFGVQNVSGYGNIATPFLFLASYTVVCIKTISKQLSINQFVARHGPRVQRFSPRELSSELSAQKDGHFQKNFQVKHRASVVHIYGSNSQKFWVMTKSRHAVKNVLMKLQSFPAPVNFV